MRLNLSFLRDSHYLFLRKSVELLGLDPPVSDISLMHTYVTETRINRIESVHLYETSLIPVLVSLETNMIYWNRVCTLN